MLLVSIYLYWCSPRFQYKMMFVSCQSHLIGVACGAGTSNPSGAPKFTPRFSGVHVARSLVFCSVFCRSLLAFFRHDIVYPSLIYGFWLPLCYLQTVLIQCTTKATILKTDYPFLRNGILPRVMTFQIIWSPKNIWKGFWTSSLNSAILQDMTNTILHRARYSCFEQFLSWTRKLAALFLYCLLSRIQSIRGMGLTQPYSFACSKHGRNLPYQF